ncbi:MAG TPA: hypothetical protein VKS79_09545 [Gemmataceae bacterium]|nr:hypothetical protein [Gemmataceae bacterium]
MAIKRWAVAIMVIGLFVIPMFAQYPTDGGGGNRFKSFGGGTPGGTPSGYGGAMPRGFGGPGGGGGWNPSQFVDMIFQGKDAININEVADPQMRGRLERAVQSMGITDGRVTRTQYEQYLQQRMAQRGMGMAPGTAPGGAATPGGPGGSPGGPAGMAMNPDSMAEGLFRRLDRDRDGVLSGDEIPNELKLELDKWDTNKNGTIELEEFKPWFAARMAARQQDWNNMQQMAPAQEEPADEPDRKPTIYRKGKLPKELDWFEKLDTDGDGQVGLYEWRQAKRSIKEFKEMDLNGDGFITVEEAMFYVKLHTPHPAGGDTAIAGNFPNNGGGPGGPMPGAFGPGFNRGAMPASFNISGNGPPAGMQRNWGGNNWGAGNRPSFGGPGGFQRPDAGGDTKGGDGSMQLRDPSSRMKGYGKKDRGN